MDEETTRGESAGIAVSHDFGLEFSVELLWLGEPFAQQTKELVITKSTVLPSAFFKSARVLSRDGTVPRCVHVLLRWLCFLFFLTCSLFSARLCTPKKSAHTMVEVFGKRWGNHLSFKVGSVDRSGFPTFTINHFNGPVTYSSESSLDRNLDSLNPDFVSLL